MAPILIFDGDCGFCTTAAKFAERHSSSPLEIVPWQFANLDALNLTSEQTQKRVYLAVNGKNYAGHKCLAKYLLLQRNYLWQAAGALMLVWPLSWLAAGGYWLVARYRHKLPGGTPACQIGN